MDRSLDGSTIAQAKLFAQLDARSLDEIARRAHVMRILAGAYLFEQDDEATAFYVLISGRMKIAQVTPEGHQVVLRYIGPGEVFGAVPLFTNTGYPAAAIAVIESLAARWDRAATHALMERYPRIVSNALTIVGSRLQELQNRYRELSTERVEQRVAQAILRLIRQAGKKVEDGMSIEFPISRQDIAEMTGTTLHTVSRILSAWEHAGLLSSGRRHITILKPQGLAAMSDGVSPRSGRPLR